MVFIAILGFFPFSANAQLPSLGDGGEFELGAERRLGERIARELYRDPDYLDDPVIGDYVQGLWQPLLTAARQRGDLAVDIDRRFAWQILLGKDRSINAFALPGGYLGLHLGLVGAVANRDELASVLAHELSHVTQRHISRLISQQNRQTPWVMGALILGALAASKNPEATNAIIAGSQAAAAQAQLNFSRDMEREADRIGFGVMTQAGFDPQGFVTMFDKLQQASRLNDNGAFPYLRTHPMTTERIADMQARQQMTGVRVAAALTAEHAMVSARARVLSGTGPDALRARVAEAEAPNIASLPAARQAGLHYGAAIASIKLRDPASAARHAQRVRELAVSEPTAEMLARLLVAEVALEAGDPQRAVGLLSVQSRTRAEVLLACQALVAAGQPREAAERLQTWVALHPVDATAWEHLSAAWSLLGQPLRAIRADAEAHVARLDLSAALDRLKAAQEMARRAGSDHVEASIIDTRARRVESMLREQAVER
jgi:predicted Zn-dependent protease